MVIPQKMINASLLDIVTFLKIQICKHIMAIVNISISEPWYGFIVRGLKNVEGRLRKGKFAKIQHGDTLVINGSVNYTVKGIRFYNSFENMLENECILRVLPEINDVKDGTDIYRSFYSKEDEEQYGVVAIEIAS